MPVSRTCMNVEIQAPAKAAPRVDAAHLGFSTRACLLPLAQRVHHNAFGGSEELAVASSTAFSSPARAWKKLRSQLYAWLGWLIG